MLYSRECYNLFILSLLPDPQPPKILNDGTVTHQNIPLKFVHSPLNKRVIL
jgi:hypothetical protein